MLIGFREEGREKEKERNINVRKKKLFAFRTCPIWGLPDWELNLQPFGLWDDA